MFCGLVVLKGWAVTFDSGSVVTTFAVRRSVIGAVMFLTGGLMLGGVVGMYSVVV